MTDARPTLFQAIAQTLRAEITGGHYPPGARLPSEAALAARFGVNRHTVRHALAALAQGGLVQARRGAGVFVTARPADYPLGARVRFTQNLAAQGRIGTRRLSRVETRPCDASEAQALHLIAGDAVHVIEGVSLADDQPMALFRSVLPGWLEGFADQVRARGSVTQALAACGVPDYVRARTRITAKLASPVQAAALRIAPGAPILRTDALNHDLTGRPVEMGRTWFAGDRVALTLGD